MADDRRLARRGRIGRVGTAPQQLEFVHTGANGLQIVIAYSFDPARYTIEARLVVRGAEASPNLIVSLPSSLAMNEAVTAEDERALAYVVNSEQEGISSVRLDKVETERVESGPLLWTAVKNKYFVVAALGDPQTNSRFGGLVARPVQEPYAAQLDATLQPAPDGTFALRYYVGPQEPQRLAELGNQFQDVNPFGWRAFRPILRPLGHAIQWALYGLHEALLMLREEGLEAAWERQRGPDRGPVEAQRMRQHHRVGIAEHWNRSVLEQQDVVHQRATLHGPLRHLQRLQPLGVRHIETAILGLPLVEGCA